MTRPQNLSSLLEHPERRAIDEALVRGEPHGRALATWHAVRREGFGAPRLYRIDGTEATEVPDAPEPLPPIPAA